MLSASRAVVLEHREVSALLATYGVFMSAALALVWALT